MWERLHSRLSGLAVWLRRGRVTSPCSSVKTSSRSQAPISFGVMDDRNPQGADQGPLGAWPTLFFTTLRGGEGPEWGGLQPYSISF